MLLTFDTFGRARNHGKKFSNLSLTFLWRNPQLSSTLTEVTDLCKF